MFQLGVCSWSLQPSGPLDLVEKVQACGLRALQLHLDPLRSGAWKESALRQEIARSGLRLLSGMISMEGEDYTSLASIRATGGLRPDRHWAANLANARANAALAARLGLSLVSFHAGFLPHDAREPERARLIERLRAVADAFGAHGIDLALETGQESAGTLLEVLRELERPRVGVNFDPANLILYGMGEPVAALQLLGARVRQIHVKDALPSRAPGEWGSEVPVGSGGVDWRAFCAHVKRALPNCNLVIEREAGAQRIADVQAARALIEREMAA